MAQSQPEVCDFVRQLGEAVVPGEGEDGPCPNFASHTLAFVPNVPAKPSQAKVLTGGRRLEQSASRRPHASWPFLRLTTSLGSITDT
jgi:hypothetical protein